MQANEGGANRAMPDTRAVRWLRIAAAVLVVLVLLVGAANVIVLRGGSGEVKRLRDVPHAQAALVLGAQVKPSGKPSSMLADRIAAAEDLYRAHKVDKVLLSGDHGQWGYDEVGTMRKALLRDGVRPQDLFTDHAGFDTWDSAQRARKVFGVQSVVVVTQDFHMARALYAARHAGLEAAGYSADRRDYGTVMARLRVRETLARVKAVADVLTGAKPRFLGPRIPIAGDGRRSWGPDAPARRGAQQ
jgi:SanA protein